MLIVSYILFAIYSILPLPIIAIMLPMGALGRSFGLTIGAIAGWWLTSLGWEALNHRPVPVLAWAIAFLVMNTCDLIRKKGATNPNSPTVGALMLGIVITAIYTFLANSNAGWIR